MKTTLICSLDHLVVTAPTLAEGIRYVEESLHCHMEPGGQHLRMGTHNSLLKVGSTMYLEVIAVDPRAASVPRARWFELDHMKPEHSPRLATWVVRTGDIQTAVCSIREGLDSDPGPVTEMSRGSIEWLITIPEDGRLQLSGLLPSLIEWKTPAPPASRLPESGVSLLRLELHAPHDAAAPLAGVLLRTGLSEHVQVVESASDRPGQLVAVFQTPDGVVELR